MSDQWREVIRQVMKSAADRESAAGEDGYGYSMEQGFNYRYEHVTAVAALVQKLGQLLDADLEVLEAAAWLHDATKSDGARHAETGSDYAREVLSRTDFPPEKIEAAATTIANHIGLWREEPLTDLHSQILWDADKLTKLGLTFIIHLSAMAISSEKPISTADLIRMGLDADWQEKTVSSMHTAPARRAAIERLSAFKRFWNQLDRELEGADLFQSDL